MSDINKALILDRILHSKELTALEKRYLENLVKSDTSKCGKWVKDAFGTIDDERYHCSVCGIVKKVVSISKYCPNCGAKMSCENR